MLALGAVLLSMVLILGWVQKSEFFNPHLRDRFALSVALFILASIGMYFSFRTQFEKETLNVLGFLSITMGMLMVLLSAFCFGGWIISRSERKLHFRDGIFVSVFVFILAAIGAQFSFRTLLEKEALEAGFATADEYLAASRENVTDPEIWAKIILEREAEAKADEAERIRAETKQRRVEDAKCRRELSCWGEKATSAVTTLTCERFVERMAQYDYEWTDGFWEPKFSRYRWKDIESGIVTLIGDKIKFQNGFGAWSNMTYECDVSPATETVIDVRVWRGRI